MADARLTTAAEWAEKLDGADPASSPEFVAWRQEPGNEAAWQAVLGARDASIALADHPDLLALRHATVARAVLNRRERPVARWAAVAVAASLVAAVPIVLLSGRLDPDRPAPAAPPSSYETQAGQRLSTTLPDGSRMTLNVSSRVRIAYNNGERRLILTRGQAFFEVAKHQRRPFVVEAGAQEVTAHGTEFDVRLYSGSVRVALVEGKVSVASHRRGGRPINMVPNDVLTASPDGVSVLHTAGQALSLSSWSDGRLTFDDETLRDAVAEINRYSTQRLVIADAGAARLRISGSFRIGEVEPFLETLQLGFPVKVEKLGDGAVRISTRT